MLDSQYILNETAISSEAEDIFNFRYYAKKINQIIQKNTKNTDPLTIGIYGKWGDGKTSFLNILEKKLSQHENHEDSKRILKYFFNPWRYSTEDEMLFDFFDGLSKTLLLEDKSTLKKAGKYILKFSRYLKAIKLSASIGIPKSTGLLKADAKVTFEPSEIFKALGEDLIGEDITLQSLKDKINLELENSENKIAIFIDDIDRLDKDEIYTLLKIIKLNANFKNLIYIIAIDPNQVAKAICSRYGDQIEDGKKFLEKIINIPIVLPRIEKEDLLMFFEKKLLQISKSLSFADKDEEYKDILYDFKQFQFTSPREIIRVLNSFSISAFSIGEEVNLNDLFWVEYLKITDHECYNKIKQFDEKTMLWSSTGIVDFNDDLGSENIINGFREELFDNYPKSKNVINHLFPNSKGRMPINQIDSKELERKLKINSVEHFEKYFSYNVIRKVSNVNIKKLKELINNQDSTALQDHLKKLLSSDQSYKITLIIQDIIDELEDIDIRNFFYEFIFENIHMIPSSGRDLFGIDERTRLIETIARNLNKDSDTNNSELITILSAKLDLTSLCYYTRKFDNNKSYKKQLYELIVEKAKELEQPFFENPKNYENKMIMSIWKDTNEEEFSKYIADNINEENLKLLIRNFPALWNDIYFGQITQENYNYLKQLLDIDLLIKKINEFYPELILDNYDPSNWSDFEENSIEQNIQQVLYWYKEDQKNQKLLLL